MEGRWVREAWTTDSGLGGGCPEGWGRDWMEVFKEREDIREDRLSCERREGLNKKLSNKLRMMGESWVWTRLARVRAIGWEREGRVGE